MAIVKPFKAVRATRDKVALVSSRSYDAYSPAELGAQLNFNPFSFLHIISPSFNGNANTSTADRFHAIKEKYNAFKTKHTYIKEEKAAFYIYKKITPTASFVGIVAATSTQDYANNVIKKHEKTIKKREILFKNYLKATGFNAEPVLITYPQNKSIDVIIGKYTKKRSEYEFTAENNNTHLLWIVDDNDDITTITNAFSKIKSLYIADGHHRSASSYLLAKDLQQKNKNHTGKEPYNFCLSYLISEKNLKIFEYNRLIKDLNGLSKEAFLTLLQKKFNVTLLEKNTFKPSGIHTFSMYLDNNVYLIEFQKDKSTYKSALHELDTHILQKYIFKKILGISNPRKDKRIVYANNTKGQIHLKTKVATGKFALAFGLFPISIEQLKRVADQGLKMPPKSTYITPKLRSGLLIYEF